MEVLVFFINCQGVDHKSRYMIPNGKKSTCRKIVSSYMYRFEAHEGFFKLLMNGFFILMYYDLLTKS